MKESKIFTKQNFSEKVHYVYRVTINEKYYIGKRTGFLNDLHTGAYTTSSKIIQEKLQNGHRFSKIKIIQVFSTEKDALEFESRILTRVNAKANPKFLNQTNGNKDFYCSEHTEETKEKMSKIHKERFNPETEQGIKNREINSKSKKEYYKTEEGRKRSKNHSEIQRDNWDKNTEQGKKLRENISENQRNNWNKNTEQGRKRREHISNKRKEKAKEQLQKRINASILGDLMFDEGFIKENFLIIDNKNNPRFLSSAYSKLSGYCGSHICEEKRIGKLSFLSGITSISISEEDENAKIEEIKAVIKSRNN